MESGDGDEERQGSKLGKSSRSVHCDFIAAIFWIRNADWSYVYFVRCWLSKEFAQIGYGR